MLIRKIGLEAPYFPKASGFEDRPIPAPEDFSEKSYQSIYATLEQRKTLIQGMEDTLRSPISWNTTVTQISTDNRLYRLTVNQLNSYRKELTAKSILLASGRFGPLLTHRSATVPKLFRRLEVGIRIEQPSNKFFLATHPQVDPEYIILEEGKSIELRTFCCCREGEVIAIKHEGFNAISGRSDVVATGRSNVGFLVRFKDAAVALRLWSELSNRLHSSPISSRMTLADLLAADDPGNTVVGCQLGPKIARLIVFGLRRLIEHIGNNAFADAIVHAPALEGFGEYPAADCSLRIPNTCIWAAGDVNGRFRGLIAALVSGHFAGQQIVREIREAR